jgi:hypothetical protein
MNKSQLAPFERQQRSRLMQLLTNRWIVRGSLTLRSRRCGKPNCRCLQGELHQSLYLTQSQQGKPRQLYVPADWEARIRQAVADYQTAQQLLEDISQLEWQRIQERKEL